MTERPPHSPCRRNDRHNAHEFEVYGRPFWCPGHAPIPQPRSESGTALRDRIAEALVSWTYRGKGPEHGGILETVRANAYSRADAVLAVLPATTDQTADRYRAAWLNARRRASVLSAEITRRAPLLGEYAAQIKGLRTMYNASEARVSDLIDERDRLLETRVDRAAVLREAADALDNSERLRDLTDDHMLNINAAANELRRMADETQPAETPWPTVTDFSIEVWECDTWVGVTYKRQTLDDARERRDSFRRRFPEARLRIVRWDETSTVVEADPEPAAGARQDGAQP
ncbi:hypothetical protein ABZ173_10080 [Streptomyces rochei]|uniref:hypothetical protein n=1 Tax=Streptomyces rochei TaxID=1928 RepID=UPI0033AB5681